MNSHAAKNDPASSVVHRTRTGRRTTVLTAGVAALALLAACGSGPTREDAISEFESVGFTTETAECLIDDLEAQGFEVGDLTGDISAEVEAGIGLAVETCLTTGDLGGLVASDEVRTQFVDGLVESGQFDVDQAECIVDHLERDGASIVEMTASDDFDEQIGAAVAACL